MTKRFALIMLAIIGIFIGILITSKDKASGPGTGIDPNQLTNHIVEAPKGVVTLTEYGDFACPACYQYYPLVEQIREKYKGQLSFQFRHYPLVEIHQNALVSAKAAEAADKQGKFWEMYKKLYENQPEWFRDNNPQRFFDEYAKQLEMDVQKFRDDMKSDEVNSLVQADRSDAKQQKFEGTPTFVLDGKRIDSPVNLEAFEKVIDDAIKAKQSQNPTP